jgi:hypothetical protein
MRRRLPPLLGLLLIAALVVALEYYARTELDRRGEVASGEVVRKKEYMRVRGGSWSRHLEVAIRYAPTPSSRLALSDVAVDEATFDRLRVGSRVGVRYLADSWLTRLGLVSVRLADQPSGGGPRPALGPLLRDLLPVAATALLACALIVLWHRTRSWLAGIGAALAALAAFTVIYTPHLPPVPSGPLGRAWAMVREVNRVTNLGPQREETPSKAFAVYQLVQLAFVPPSVGDTVVAMDAIDEGSVSALAPGTRVAITYALHDPRAARMEGARRTFARTNRVGLWTLGAVVFAVIGLLLLARAAWGRLRQRGAGRSSPLARGHGPQRPP